MILKLHFLIKINLRYMTCIAIQYSFPTSHFWIFQVHVKPKVPTKAVCTQYLELRKEILTLLNLQRQVFLPFETQDGNQCHYPLLKWVFALGSCSFLQPNGIITYH